MHVLARIEPARLRRTGRKREGGTGRRVEFVFVVSLGDFDVELRGQRARGDAHQFQRDGDADRGVRRDEHRDVARRAVDARIETGVVARRADDDRNTRRLARIECAQRQLGPREVDCDGGLAQVCG